MSSSDGRGDHATPRNTYELAKLIVDFEFFAPESKNMNRQKLIEKYEAQIDNYIETRVADTIIGMLVGRIHKDETTDYTGFNISKEAVGKHAGKVMRDIQRGALHSVHVMGKFIV
jgi:hypothetical protein